MKVQLLLGEAASMHTDGTVSVLRAGITHAWNSQTPVPFKGTLVALIRPDLGDLRDTHSFDLRCLDQDGSEQIPTIKGSFNSTPGARDGVSAIAMEMQIGFTKYGTYVFVIRVDNRIEDEWRLIVARPPEPPSSQETKSTG